ncbi:MAG: hypothetical protein HC934_13100 [Acaryochloridaceae cyanobacterium SU_2_1]|nr:hypothetical protein [Acaryochloridaceae cyanobacterium SU_2_1]
MIPEIAVALDRQDFEMALQLIKALPTDHPWGRLYQGQLYEAQELWEKADSLYRQLLRQEYGPGIAKAARQGLQRLQDRQQALRQQKLSEAMDQPGQNQLGVLVLEPLSPEEKAEVVPQFAQVMQIDPYTARLLIPSRGWRLYRVGPIGELTVYGQELQRVGVPCFWTTLAQVKALQVYPASYFKALGNLAEVVVQCSDPQTKLQQPQDFSFAWSDVAHRVEGLVPIFEEVVDLDPRGKLKRKEQIQDHAQFCDLHLPKQGCILRFYDAVYQFRQGVPLTTAEEETSWANWRALRTLLDQYLPKIPSWSEFTPFAETAVEQMELLGEFESYINLFRREDSKWDQAFHLYSSLAMLKP